MTRVKKRSKRRRRWLRLAHRDAGHRVARCQECGSECELTTGAEVYPHIPRLHELPVWICRPCGAYVGCHTGTTLPLGTAAGKALRGWRRAAHDAFDPTWRRGGNRTRAYAWLAREMGLSREACHIGMMDIEQCKQVVEICQLRSKGR